MKRTPLLFAMVFALAAAAPIGAEARHRHDDGHQRQYVQHKKQHVKYIDVHNHNHRGHWRSVGGYWRFYPKYPVAMYPYPSAVPVVVSPAPPIGNYWYIKVR
jgi:hypothetical protein